jgi:NHLM bacteriocin system ABC transporter ATP-binding protein
MTMDDGKQLQSGQLELSGNRVVALDDPGSAWVVESGSVAVFTAVLRDGEPVGRRRFVFSCGPADLLFGLPQVEEGRPAAIAVALEQSVIRRLPLGELRGDEELMASPVAAWIERWIAAVDEDLEHGIGAGGPLERLSAFQRQLVGSIDSLHARKGSDEISRLTDRERRSREVTREAVERLTSVLRLDARPLPGGPDLFVAAHTVAVDAGITLRRPSAWESHKGPGETVEAITRASHVRFRQVQLHDGWWREDCGPLLGFTRDGRRPVALLPDSPGRYRVFDPATKARARLDTAAAAALEPEAYQFYRPLPEQSTGAMTLLRFALRGRARDLGIILATGVGATLLGMFTPQATAWLVDRAIPDADTRLIWHIGLGLAAAAIGGAIFRLSQGIALLRVETGADAVTQAAVWDRLLNLQLAFFRRYSTGDLQSRVTAVSQIRAYLGGTTMRTLFSAVILLLNLGLLVYYSAPLTVVAVLVAALSATVTVASGTMILRYSRQVLELEGRFFGLLVQLINGLPKLRVAAAEERAFARWATEYSTLLRLGLQERRIQDAVRVINIGVSTLGAIVLFGTASMLVRGGAGLTTGVFLAFYVAYGTFIGAIVNLSNTVTDVMAIAILRERSRPILEALPEVTESKANPGRLAGRLDLEHIEFRYDAEGPLILDDVSMHVEPGQFVAVVGPSGSGKSTLFRMILGFETPRSGSILYDGQDLSGLDVFAVRRQMGVVLQSGRINAGSIFENIAAGSHVSLNDAWEAARATGFADEISAMPMGMHTVISEGGTNLSGGQRQRLLLARALVHKPAILLLDEATSALDNTTQAIVSESLERLQVTRVVIAHRLSTIRGADRIYVVESGRIVQQGTFGDLAAEDGLFQRLMARQLA